MIHTLTPYGIPIYWCTPQGIPIYFYESKPEPIGEEPVGKAQRSRRHWEQLFAPACCSEKYVRTQVQGWKSRSWKGWRTSE